MKRVFGIILLAVSFASCDSSEVEQRNADTEMKRKFTNEVTYMKDTTTNLCFAVWLDHFSDLRIICVPCDSIKNKLK